MAIERRMIVDAVVKGITAANTKYEKMSGGNWLTDAGVEGYMVARVAEMLHNALGANGILLLEARFDAMIRKQSGTSPLPGPHQEVVQGTQRADITLFDQQRKPTHVVEVKRVWDKNPCCKDIKRLLGLLDACGGQADGSLKLGLLGLLIAEKGTTWDAAKESVKRKAQIIENDVRTRFGLNQEEAEFTLGCMRRYPECWDDKEEFAAAGFCIALSG